MFYFEFVYMNSGVQNVKLSPKKTEKVVNQTKRLTEEKIIENFGFSGSKFISFAQNL